MLSKCANPGCTAKFSYLHQGKLFRRDIAESISTPDASFAEYPEMKMPARHVEFFWLCDECAAAMTLTFDRNAGVLLHPLKRAAAAASSL